MEIQKYDYKLGDWCVDLNSASLFTDSQQIHIELKAMEVLQTLVLAKGEVVRRLRKKFGRAVCYRLRAK
jgi:DNA-binding winged helix-turn-helix (wHTH) protein